MESQVQIRTSSSAGSIEHGGINGGMKILKLPTFNEEVNQKKKELKVVHVPGTEVTTEELIEQEIVEHGICPIAKFTSPCLHCAHSNRIPYPLFC